MKLLTISNLYPRPDQPQRGIFNAQLFSAMAEQMQSVALGLRQKDSGQSFVGLDSGFRFQVSGFINICLVPEWRLWRWPGIARWGKKNNLKPQTCPAEAMGEQGRRRMNTDEHRLCNRSESNLLSVQVSGFRPQVSTVYLPAFYLPILGRNLSWWFYGLSLARLADEVKCCDAVFSTWLYPDGVAATMFAQRLALPSWIMVQGSDTFHLDNPARRRIILDACEKARGVICVCRSLADRMISAGVDSSKVHVVPNGVDGELFKFRTKEDAVKGLPAGSWLSRVSSLESRIVLFVGNLVPVKGPDILLEAWGRLRRLRPETGNLKSGTGTEEEAGRKAEGGNVKPEIGKEGKERDTVTNLPTRFEGESGERISGLPPSLKQLWRTRWRAGRSQVSALVFIGSGPMRQQLEAQAGALGIADSVFFLGNRSHEEVALWMNAADCLCLPSRSEGMPNVVIEALASGLPVVATDVGGVRELLEAGVATRIVMENGKRKAEGNESLVSDLAAAIDDILKVDHDRKPMAESNIDRFSWKKQAGMVLELMKGQGRRKDLKVEG